MSSLSKVNQYSFERPIHHNDLSHYDRLSKVDNQNLKIGKCLFVSEAMQEIFCMLPSIASTPYPVLILGETGVGKSTLAEAIHLSSSRKNGPFVRVNCATLNESLMGSELFGHEKGQY